MGDRFEWSGYINQAIARDYVFVNWPYGLSAAKHWSDNNPVKGPGQPIAVLLAAILHEDPQKRLCLIHRRHCTCVHVLFVDISHWVLVDEDAQPALISYVSTEDGSITAEETVLYETGPVMPTEVSDCDPFGPCDCNLEKCQPPDLEQYLHLRPRWVLKPIRIDGGKKRKEPEGKETEQITSKRIKVPKE